MLNKRAAVLLALVLAGSMALSGPSAAVASASSGDSKKTSQTETEEKKSESADSVKDKKEETKSSKKSKAKKQASGNSVSSSKGKAAEEDDEEDLPKAGVSGNSASGGSSENARVPQGHADSETSPSPTVTISPTITVSPTAEASPTVSAVATATPSVSDQQAKAEGNQICQINEGAVYPSGVAIPFYAVGAGYGPDEPQERDPAAGATRYVPVSWNVATVSGGTAVSSGSWTGYTVSTNGGEVSGDRVPGEYRFGASFVLSTDQTAPVPYTLNVSYQEEVYRNGKWEADDAPVSKSVHFSIMKVSVTSTPTVSPTAVPSVPPTDTPTGRPTVTPTGRPIVTPTDTPDQQADPTQNGLYWINEGATYRSGASLQFYATGAGYGPDEVQESDPVAGATRYVPISWSVVATSSGGTTGVSGTWTKKNREVTRGSLSGSNYTAGEYRFKSSFVLSTNLTTSVPYTLRVNYQREVYGGRKWRTDNSTPATKSVNFYIRNTAWTTATPRPTSTYYNRYGVTSTAARSSVSSNAQNASTEDNTPIGALMLLMMAAAGSGLMIFRKKQNRS